MGGKVEFGDDEPGLRVSLQDWSVRVDIPNSRKEKSAPLTRNIVRDEEGREERNAEGDETRHEYVIHVAIAYGSDASERRVD